MAWRCPGTQKERTIHFFVLEIYIEDTKQDEKHVLDLLEPIMKPKLFVKEELLPTLFKMRKIILKIKTIRVSTFWVLEIQSFPAGGQCQPARR